jgi:hypothetical protein
MLSPIIEDRRGRRPRLQSGAPSLNSCDCATRRDWRAELVGVATDAYPYRRRSAPGSISIHHNPAASRHQPQDMV